MLMFGNLIQYIYIFLTILLNYFSVNATLYQWFVLFLHRTIKIR